MGARDCLLLANQADFRHEHCIPVKDGQLSILLRDEESRLSFLGRFLGQPLELKSPVALTLQHGMGPGEDYGRMEIEVIHFDHFSSNRILIISFC